MSAPNHLSISSLVDRAVDFNADPNLQDVLAHLARTEDVRFSPNGRRIAVAGFTHGTIQILELSEAPVLTLTGSLNLYNDAFKEPHGLDWFDNCRMAVANRGGTVSLIDVPAPRIGQHDVNISIAGAITMAARLHRIKSPGSLAIDRFGDTFGLWVCNNYEHRVTYHKLQDDNGTLRPQSNKIALRDGLSIPDGVAINPNSRVMAISNHETHEVFLYALTAPGQARRIGELTTINYPHGIRFTPDGTHMIVADAGQPHLIVFRTDTDWGGSHAPARYVRVMDDETFLRGRFNVAEGGLKGIDIARGLVAATCETQPLRFFALEDVLGNG